jgi:hypothetical protein
LLEQRLLLVEFGLSGESGPLDLFLLLFLRGDLVAGLVQLPS